MRTAEDANRRWLDADCTARLRMTLTVSGFLPTGTMAEGGAEGLCGFVEGHPGDDPVRAYRAEGGWKHPCDLQGATSVPTRWSW